MKFASGSSARSSGGDRRFDSEAEAEVRAAITRYEGERSGLGDEFWTEVQDMLALIEAHHERT